MTDTAAIDLLDFVRTFKEEIDATSQDIHPYAQAIIHEWLGEMFAEAAEGASSEVARLCTLVRDKIALERSWNESDKIALARSFWDRALT